MKTTVFFTPLVLFFTILMMNVPSEAKGKNASKAVITENDTEEVLTIENWMVNPLFWGNSENNVFTLDHESKLLLESWMTDRNLWNMAVLSTIDTEKPLDLEPWMTDESVWSIKSTAEKGSEENSTPTGS